MKTYEIALKHDAGSVTLRTRSTSIEAAKAQVCAAEGAPLSAVTWWRVVPTAKQVRRTQSLMRGL